MIAAVFVVVAAPVGFFILWLLVSLYVSATPGTSAAARNHLNADSRRDVPAPSRPVVKEPPALTTAELIQAHCQALKGPEGDARCRAATALGKLGPAAASAVPALIEALKDSDPTGG